MMSRTYRQSGVEFRRRRDVQEGEKKMWWRKTWNIY